MGIFDTPDIESKNPDRNLVSRKVYLLGYIYIYIFKLFVPGRVYYYKPSKIVLIMQPDNITSGIEFDLRHRFKVCMGTHYLGGFIGDEEYKHDWLKYWT